tara:strand:- start:176 stop:646 length:471 start_codon:yes stop_codon:yes gene_type:complete
MKNMMNNNNTTYVSKTEFNLALTLLIITLIVLVILGYFTTKSILTLNDEVDQSIERDLTNLGLTAQNQTEAELSINKLEQELVKANAEDIIELRAADGAALKRDIGIREDLVELQSKVLELQKMIKTLQDEEIKDLLELPQVELKGQYPHPRLHGL